jgi:hypothetical protein
MNDSKMTQLTPAEEDPIVDRWLASLVELSPGDGFEDAVMARVWVPVPHWVRSVQSTIQTLLSRKRVWVWTGGLAASSAASMAVIVALMVSHWVQIETAWSLRAGSFLLQAWRLGVTLIGQTLATAIALREAWGVTGTMTLFAGLVGGAVSAFSAFGLYRILMGFNTERISFHASR